MTYGTVLYRGDFFGESDPRNKTGLLILKESSNLGPLRSRSDASKSEKTNKILTLKGWFVYILSRSP